jgi:hypothetical protein
MALLLCRYMFGIIVWYSVMIMLVARVVYTRVRAYIHGELKNSENASVRNPRKQAFGIVFTRARTRNLTRTGISDGIESGRWSAGPAIV